MCKNPSILLQPLPMTLVCIGCGKAFQTQRSLSAHEARCNANKQLTTNIYARHHKRHTKSKKRKERSLSESDSSESSQHEDGPSRHSPSPIPSFSIDVGEVQAEVEALPGHLPAPPSLVGPPPVVSARSGRHVRLPARYRDFLPGELLSLDHVPPPPLQSPPPASQRSDSQPASKSSEFRMEVDSFGLFRIYPNQPTHIPHVKTTLSDVVDAPTLLQTSAESAGLPNIIPPSEITVDNLFSAFSSPTAGLLMCWHYTKSTTKTKEELNRIWVYISDPLFNPSQQPNFSHDREYRLASKYLQDDSNPFRAQHGWTCSAVTIPLIKEGVKYTSETDLTLPTLIIDNIYHRSITDIMTSVFSDHASSSFHFTPFNQYWTTADGRNICIYSEAYMSAEMDEAHRQINAAPRQPDDNFERVVVPIMLWSDATQLANFGDASLWPVYLYFGSQSKYIRGKPTSGACHHVAYIPSLPDNFQDTYTQNHSEASTGELYTHFKRELMHAVWGLLLDGKFVEAHKTGILIECVDHIIRQFFPRLYSYSANYPEKVLLACIKFLGNCLCPRCFVEKAAVPDMGKPSDMMTRTTQLRVNNNAYQSAIKAARKLIFGGKSLNSKRVTDLLKDTSWVPTRNAFSERLSEDRELFNFFLLFVVDLLHEFELGVWKAIFTHLLRILHAQGGSSITELNWRYRATPMFGRGTIRRFHKNASSMKRLAARDFEDLLQCAIPIFEGLLPSPHNETVLDLLFDLATWQAFAKLRMHTDDTLSFFDTMTRQLGYSARRFKKTTSTIAKEPQAQETSSAAKIKKLNLSTYKFHALGDYPEMICQYGTTDSYSTQIGELEHRRSKQRFARSGKRKETRTASIANQEVIERFISKVDATREALRTVHTKKNQAGGRRTRTRPEEHYHIAASTRNAHDLTVWLGEKEYDPAVTDFIPHLKDHLLARKRGLAYNGDEYDFSDQDRSCNIIRNNQLFEHAFLRVNISKQQKPDYQA
ncbi:hypothetical protein OG21DRAFT_1499714 [Imleria badia]|nr:hypothetical protein OG21DRAFT_1499714 [Imleria badia]